MLTQDDPSDKSRHPLDPKILPATTAVLTIIIGVVATRCGLNITPESLVILATGTATLIVCYLQWRKCHAAESGVKRAEEAVPGITTVNGPTAPVTVIKNDASLPGPPDVSHPTNLEGDHK